MMQYEQRAYHSDTTLLTVQRVSPVAPGAIYSLFAVLGLVGMCMSTKIHQDGGLEDVDNESSPKPTTEMTDAAEEEEETEREIV